MPLFGRNTSPVEEPAPRRTSIFSRNSPSSSPTETNHNRSGSIFGRRSQKSTESNNSNGSNGRSTGGLFGHNDPHVSAAKQRISDAEKAEKAADQALIQARNAVREAKNHAKLLEREAAEQARLAKAKQAASKSVTNSTRGLGRHGE